MVSLLTGNFALDFLGIIVALIVVTVAYFKWKYTYWQRLGVPTLSPKFPYGDMKKLNTGQAAMGAIFKEFYDRFKAMGAKHGGYYTMFKVGYMPVDIELIKHVLSKDFPHFMNHGLYSNEEVDPLSAHLFALEDEKWRRMRVKLTPTFTSGKMKMMFQTVADSKSLIEVLDKCVESKEAIDIQEILARYTTDIIGSVAFGIECNSLKNPDAEFRKYGKKVFEHPKGFLKTIKMMVSFTFPKSILKMLKYRTTKPEVEEFFLSAFKKVVDYREQNNIYRKDFLHLLIQLKNRGVLSDDGKLTGDEAENPLTFNEIAAQAFVFFLGGFETSSATMTFTLYNLAANPEIQEKLRDEINAILEENNGELTYDLLQKMSYLDKVIQESLRLFPIVPILPRVCTKDYQVPGTSITIPKGTSVMIPVLGVHRDPEFYPDPDKFDPERFNEENKKKRPAFAWLPFGEGPRNCIGMRFGLLQTKVGLCTVLRNYKVSLNKKTWYPPVLAKKGFNIALDGGVWLDLEKISY